MGTCALVGMCALLSPACDKFQGRSGGVNVGGASEPHSQSDPVPAGAPWQHHPRCGRSGCFVGWRCRGFALCFQSGETSSDDKFA